MPAMPLTPNNPLATFNDPVCGMTATVGADGAGVEGCAGIDGACGAGVDGGVRGVAGGFTGLVLHSSEFLSTCLLASYSLRLIVRIIFSAFKQTSIVSLVCVVALSQASDPPEIVGVSTQTLFLCVPATYLLYFAVSMKLFASLALSSEIVYVQVLSLTVPTSALMRDTSTGALSVTTASFSATLPVFVTVIS